MIKPIKWKNSLDLLSPEDVIRIHEASLRILDKTGIVMPLPADKLEKARQLGVRYDKNTGRVHFPPAVIEEALACAPQYYDLCAPEKENDMPLDGKHGYMTTDGSATRYLDLVTHETRNSTMKDLAQLTLIADYLPQISFYWPSVSAMDTTPEIQPLYELKTVLMNTTKHVQAMTAVDSLNAKGTVEICQAVMGGKQALMDRPIISNFLCSISPLSYDEKALDAAWIFAEAGVPCGFLNMQIGCSTAPATIAGNLAMGNAEIIAGMAMMQLLYKGAKTFYGSCATTMELKTGNVNSGGPYDFMLQNMSAQMARFYKVPSNIGTMAPGAKDSDWHCGVENALSCALSYLGKADMMCGAGLICSAGVFSVEQMILDCETYDIVEESFKGIEINDDTLALDVIDAVGPNNHFMLEDHTIEHLHDMWQPKIMHRGSYDDYVKAGSKSPFTVANEMAMDILSRHKPNVTYNEKDMDYILNDYEKRIAQKL